MCDVCGIRTKTAKKTWQIRGVDSSVSSGFEQFPSTSTFVWNRILLLSPFHKELII